jgi:uncharacterized membrane protein YbhN (UPF0104 family)
VDDITMHRSPNVGCGALMRTHLRNLLALLGLVACVVVTVRVFNWQDALLAIKHVRVGFLLTGAFSILLVIYSIRGARWLAALGVGFTFGKFWQSLCANGAAAGLAVVTPFKAGEAIKVRLLPDQAGADWRQGVSGFLLERLMDLFGVLGTGGCGLLLHFGFGWFSPLPLLLPLAAGLALRVMATHSRHIPARIRYYFEAFSDTRRVVGTALLTIPLWLGYACLWWVAVAATGVAVGFSDVAIVLGGVMLLVVASMAPGGLGVSELSIRGILIWLQVSTQNAEAAAIGIRLLTPLLVGAGLICMVPLAIYRRRTRSLP